MLKIVTTPNKILISPNKPVVNFDAKLAKLIKEMDKTLIVQSDPQGVGLAAPQIGENLQLFIIKPTIQAKTQVFINPRIIEAIKGTPRVPKSRRHKTKTPLEGCLSIPRIWGPVKRAKKILLEYQNAKGEKKSDWIGGFRAVIIQHEMDHLQGVLFTERALQQKSSLYEEKEGKLEKINY